MTRKRFQKLARAKYTQQYIEWLKDPYCPVDRSKFYLQFGLRFLSWFKPKSPDTYQQTFDYIFKD